MKATRERQSGVVWTVERPGRQRGSTPVEPPSPKLVQLDPLIHERTRLAMLTALMTAADGVLSFSDLRNALHLTDGNLTTHLRTLGQAGLVEVHKTGAGRGSSTTVQLTVAGRAAFKKYLARLEKLIQAARQMETTKE
jgi:DNA-binding MarR family transcriptional regulator